MPYLAILITIGTGWAIVKRYNAHMVLLFSGLILISLSVMGGVSALLPGGTKSTGFVLFDIFELLRVISMRQISGIGFLILVAGGFSTYMERIGAADKLVQICIHPLRRFKNPYLVLGLSFLVGHALGVVVPSAAGLAMLLVVAMFPLLTGLGLSGSSAAAIIGCTLCMSYAPTSPMGLLAAKTANVTPVVYLIKYQLPIALPAAVAVAVAHVFVQRHFDRQEGIAGDMEAAEKAAEAKAVDVPACYALFPLVPLVLLIIFSPLVMKTIVLDTSTAMLIGWVVAMLVDFARRRSITKVLEDGMYLFNGMGSMLTSVVSLIFVAEFFASGLRLTGLIDLLITSAKSGGMGITGTTIMLSLCIGLITVLTGSGVAALASLIGLAPAVSASFGGEAISMVVPMQFAAEMLRPLSPVAGVMIIVAGAAKVTPMALVKRTAIPCTIGMAVIFLMNILLFS